MKSQYFKREIVLFLMVSFVFLGACQKLSNGIDNDLDSALVENTFSDVYQISEEADNGSLNSFKTTEASDIMSACATVSVDTILKVITVNFGSTNCLCEDGKNRRGSVIINYTARYRDVGSVRTITFADFYVNDNKVEGVKTVTNMGTNADGNLFFNIEVDGRIIKADGSGTVVWTSNRTREWIGGESTSTRRDDLYYVTGTATGTTADGDAFTANISSPLTIDMSCRYRITQGVIENTRGSRGTRTIDFGAGNCDNEAVVTVGSRTRTIRF